MPPVRRTFVSGFLRLMLFALAGAGVLGISMVALKAVFIANESMFFMYALAVYCGIGAVILGGVAVRNSLLLREQCLCADSFKKQAKAAESLSAEYRRILARQLRMEPLSIAAIAEDVKEHAAHILKAKGQRFSVSLPREQVWLYADRIHIVTLLAALLREASARHGEKSTIGFSAQAEAGKVKLRIGNDGGAGAPLKENESLAYARIIAELHDGCMEIGHDQAASGVFSVWLPQGSADIRPLAAVGM